MSDRLTMTLTLEVNEWGDLASLCYREAGRIAASEAERTGGYGFASGSKLNQVETLHGIRDRILTGKDDNGNFAFYRGEEHAKKLEEKNAD